MHTETQLQAQIGSYLRGMNGKSTEETSRKPGEEEKRRGDTAKTTAEPYRKNGRDGTAKRTASNER